MIAKSVDWTMGSSAGHPDAVEFDIEDLGPDQVLVKINGRVADRADLDQSCCGEDATHGPQEACRGVGGRVIEAGANALWFVDRSVIIPAGGRCGDCDASQRVRAEIFAMFRDQSLVQRLAGPRVPDQPFAGFAR